MAGVCVEGDGCQLSVAEMAGFRCQWAEYGLTPNHSRLSPYDLYLTPSFQRADAGAMQRGKRGYHKARPNSTRLFGRTIEVA